MAGTITVASKLPWPLTLHLEEMHEYTELTNTGGVTLKRYNRLPLSITIKGVARDLTKPQGDPIHRGYALTHGVDAEFFAKWMETHKDFPPVVTGAIFAVPKGQDAIVETKNYVDVRTGLEPVDPQNPPPEFAKKISAA